MARSTGIRLTKAGENLLAKLHTGKVEKIELKSFALGDSVWTAEEIENCDRTALKNELVRAPIESVTIGTGTESGKVIASGLVTNTTVSSAFYVREIGIIAQDPDLGEILYLIDPIAEHAPTTVVESNAVRQDLPIRVELIAVSRDQVRLVISEGIGIVSQEQLENALIDIRSYVDQRTTDVDAKTLQGKTPNDFSAWDHNHDGRNYTKTEVDSKLAEKAGSVHSHTKKDVGLEKADNTADAEKHVKSAGSATKLTTGVRINGVYFDGTTDITLEGLAKPPQEIGDFAFSASLSRSPNTNVDATLSMSWSNGVTNATHIEINFQGNVWTYTLASGGATRTINGLGGGNYEVIARAYHSTEPANIARTKSQFAWVDNPEVGVAWLHDIPSAADVVVKWDGAVNATHYMVQRNTGAGWQDVSGWLDANARQWSTLGTVSGSYRIQFHNTHWQKNSWSREVYYSVPDVGGVALNAISAGIVANLSWTPLGSVANATGFHIFRNGVHVHSTTANSWADAPNAGASYYVQAYNGNTGKASNSNTQTYTFHAPAIGFQSPIPHPYNRIVVYQHIVHTCGGAGQGAILNGNWNFTNSRLVSSNLPPELSMGATGEQIFWVNPGENITVSNDEGSCGDRQISAIQLQFV